MKKLVHTLAVFASLPIFAVRVSAGDPCQPDHLTLFPANQSATADTEFGGTISTLDDLVFILSAGSNERSVILYDSLNWSELRRFIADEPSTPSNFGRDIVAYADRVLISADDAVYLFDINNGTQLRKITQPTGSSTEGFGASIAMDNIEIFVGATRSSTSLTDPSTVDGAVYVFDAATGAHTNTLSMESSAVWDGFGSLIRIDNDYLYITAANDIYAPSGGLNQQNRGTISIYDRTSMKLELLLGSELQHELSYPTREYGSPFVIYNRTVSSHIRVPGCQSGEYPEYGIVIRSPTGGPTGALYEDCYGDINIGQSMAVDESGIAGYSYSQRWYKVFDSEFRHWVVLHDLTSADPTDTTNAFQLPHAYFTETGDDVRTITVGLTDKYVLAGLDDAVDDDGYGRVLVYFREDCELALYRANLNHDEVLDIFDLFAFLDLFATNIATADLDCNGVWDIFDVLAYLDEFNTACP